MAESIRAVQSRSLLHGVAPAPSGRAQWQRPRGLISDNLWRADESSTDCLEMKKMGCRRPKVLASLAVRCAGG